jgi:hypothetical protein
MVFTFIAHKRDQHMTPQRATDNSYRNQQLSGIRSGEPGLYLEPAELKEREDVFPAWQEASAR